MLCLAIRQAQKHFREEGSRLHQLLIWACMQALGHFREEDGPPPHMEGPSMEVALSDEQPGQIMPRNRYFVLQRSRKASASIGEGR